MRRRLVMPALTHIDRRLVLRAAAAAMIAAAAAALALPPRAVSIGPKNVFAEPEAVQMVALTARVDRSRPPIQCAIYARQRSGLDLSGAARQWWAQAEGRYPRSHTPAAGAVIVMGGTRAGHVGVVSAVLDERNILIDHANWLNTGEIVTHALVRDISPANDWSQVRVWHPPTRTLGLTAYPVYGFIHPVPDPPVNGEQGPRAQ